MSRVTSGNARVTVSFRISTAQLQALDDLSDKYSQGRGDLIREAVQVWVNRQLQKSEIPDAVH